MSWFNPRGHEVSVDALGTEHVSSDIGTAGTPYVEIPTFDGHEHAYTPTREDPTDDYNTFSISVQNNQGGILVLGEDPQRRKARLWCVNGGVVVGKQTQVASGNGGFISQFFVFEFESTRALYANLPQGDGGATQNPVVLSVHVERDTAENV